MTNKDRVLINFTTFFITICLFLVTTIRKRKKKYENNKKRKKKKIKRKKNKNEGEQTIANTRITFPLRRKWVDSDRS